MNRGISLTEAINHGYGVWMVGSRDEVVKLQRKLSATASQKGVKIKSRSYVTIDQTEDLPQAMYTVTATVV